MRAASTETAPDVAHGVVQRINLIEREVTVRQESGSVTYSVSPGCEVLLNGERVKLRMLQPRDRVRVAFRRRTDGKTALSVEAVTRTERSRVADR